MEVEVEMEMEDLGGLEAEEEAVAPPSDSQKEGGPKRRRQGSKEGEPSDGEGDEGGAQATVRGASWTRGLVTFLKAMLGAAILSLPRAFAEAGVLASSLVYLFVGAICVYCEVTLIQVKQEVEETAPEAQTFAAVGRAVLGKWGEGVITLQVVLLEWAFCSGILLVMASTLHTVMPALNETVAVLLAVPLLVLLSNIRLLREMWVLVYFGCLVYFVGVFGVVLFYGLQAWDEREEEPLLVSWAALPVMVGSAVYSIEGINLVIPVEATLRQPSHGVPVIAGGTVLVIFLNTAFAAFSYLVGFGQCAIVTDCLPDTWLSAGLQLALATALLLTYPVALYPATEIIEDLLLPSSRDIGWRESKRFICRSLQVAFTGVIAIVTPNFALYTSLLGAMFMSVIGFVIPPLLFMVHRGRRLHKVEVVLNVAILVGGVVFFFVGTSTAAAAIIRFYFPGI